MPDGHTELVETEEFTAQIDDIVARHSMNVILPVLAGLFDGIAKNPRAFGRTIGHLRCARSDSLGLTIPTFTVLFQIQNEGQENEHVLLGWIQENSALDEIMEF
jgi:hypothetical protein